MLTYKQIKNNDEINSYITMADSALESIGFTEHSFAHVTRTAEIVGKILTLLDYDERTVELGKIAGYMHDIGNCVNRVDHAQSGALMAFRILDKMGMSPDEIAKIVCAIGNHDEKTANPVNAITAALILADKSDVRRSRVRNTNYSSFGIHDRVNYAVKSSNLIIDSENAKLSLHLTIDESISSISEYFEIFLDRMLLCRRAAEFFNMKFELIMNDIKVM